MSAYWIVSCSRKRSRCRCQKNQFREYEQLQYLTFSLIRHIPDVAWVLASRDLPPLPAGTNRCEFSNRNLSLQISKRLPTKPITSQCAACSLRCNRYMGS